MKKLLLAAIALTGVLSDAMGQNTSYVFDWSAPATLSPAYPAPNAANRYGEYISNVTFTSGPVTFTIDDNSVKEQSQRARFLYGYLTEEVEMRAYPTSVITIAVPEDVVITSVTFEGAKVDTDYMDYYGQYGRYEGSTWTSNGTTDVHQVEFEVNTTINCTRTTVVLAQSGIGEIEAESAIVDEQWYTLQGVCLPSVPVTHGLYIVRSGDKARLVKH